MRLLSFAVAAFSLVCIAVAPWTASAGGATLLGGTGLVAAFAVYRAQHLSAFLKIFVTIFASEVLVFGLAYLTDKSGLWPAAYRSYVLPDSLPVSVAIFAILVWLVSHLPVIRAMTDIADGYFKTSHRAEAGIGRWRFHAAESVIAKSMIVFLVVVNQAQVGISVRLSFFSRDWFNAIQTKDETAFWTLLLFVFTPWAFVYIFSAVVEYVVKSMLIIRWRQWLTGHYVGRWLDGATHYRMALAGGAADNPDQRIAEDVNRFIDGGDTGYGIYSYTILLISTVSSLVSFSIILWGLSTNFTLPGTDILVPGFLFWVVLIYASIGTYVTHKIGRVLVPMFFSKQKFEARFRFSLARMREYGEQIALLQGEHTERQSTMGYFGDIVQNYLNIVARQKILIAFTNFYGQIGPIIPYILTAPFYFLGKVTLGVMTQTAGAFGRVEGGLNFFVNYYASLAEFRSVLDRLSTFDLAIETARGLGTADPRITFQRPHVAANVPADGPVALHLKGLILHRPDGKTIVHVADLALAGGQAILITGPSGAGKSTLFRAIAGIWPFGQGVIQVPAGQSVMLLPQRPYIPIGTLRDAVAYPAHAAQFSREALVDVLRAASLPDFIPLLDTDENWAQRLSGGEQQRVAIARALLVKPDWLFLDEATAALDEATEAAMYGILRARLTHTTLVSIGHRRSLIAYHQRQIELVPDATGATVREAAGAELV